MAARRRTQPRKVPRQSRSRDLVAAIVEAATRVLAAEGFENMNVNRVAELAGVSVGSLYQYYPSKEALAGAVAEKLGEETARLVATRLAALVGLAPREAIRGAVACALEAYRLNPPLRRVIRDEVPAAIPHFATPSIDDELRRGITDYLIAHRASLRPDDLELAMRIVFTAVEAVSERMADVDQALVLDELSVLLERYLLKEVR